MAAVGARSTGEALLERVIHTSARRFEEGREAGAMRGLTSVVQRMWASEHGDDEALGHVPDLDAKLLSEDLLAVADPSRWTKRGQPQGSILSGYVLVRVLDCLLDLGADDEAATVLRIFLRRPGPIGARRLNAMIRVFAKQQMFDVVLALLQGQRERGMHADKRAQRTTIDAMAKANLLEPMETVFEAMLEDGTLLSTGVVTTVLNALARAGRFADGVALFHRARERMEDGPWTAGHDGGAPRRSDRREAERREDARLYAALLRCEVGAGLDPEATLREMEERRLRPDAYTLAAVLKACSTLEGAMAEVARFEAAWRVQPDRVCFNLLLSVCWRCGDLAGMRSVLAAMEAAGIAPARDTHELVALTWMAAHEPPPPHEPLRKEHTHAVKAIRWHLHQAELLAGRGRTHAERRHVTARTFQAAVEYCLACARTDGDRNKLVRMLRNRCNQGSWIHPSAVDAVMDDLLKAGHSRWYKQVAVVKNKMRDISRHKTLNRRRRIFGDSAEAVDGDVAEGLLPSQVVTRVMREAEMWV